MDLALLLRFLTQLAANNNTAWMANHCPAYQRARAAISELAALRQEIHHSGTEFHRQRLAPELMLFFRMASTERGRS